MKCSILVLTYFCCFSYSSVESRLNNDDQYIIKLKSGTNAAQFISRSLLKSSNGDVVSLNTLVEHVFSTVFDGFSAKLDKSQLSLLQKNNEVEVIVENHLAKTVILPLDNVTEICDEWTTQRNSVWGLARVSAKSRLSNNGPYHYNYRISGGQGVTVYVVDTGVYTQHNDLRGRAETGVNYVSTENDNDNNGHGTHVSGTIAGTNYGIAKNARIVAVKVLNYEGVGLVSWIVAGIEWVIENVNTPRLSVINLSLGANANTLLDEAVRKAVNSGITVVVAAGNSANNACNNSPAREPLAITVAASDINDISASFTSYGSCVDLYAPGVGIISSWIGSSDSTHTESGTSMASPHVAGLAACFISEYNTANPSDVELLIKSNALRNQLSSVPSNTVNLLLNNNATTELCGNSATAIEINIILVLMFVFIPLLLKL